MNVTQTCGSPIKRNANCYCFYKKVGLIEIHWPLIMQRGVLEGWKGGGGRWHYKEMKRADIKVTSVYFTYLGFPICIVCQITF